MNKMRFQHSNCIVVFDKTKEKEEQRQYQKPRLQMIKD